VYYAFNARPEVGLERQHIPVVAYRNDRLLDNLLKAAVLKDAGHAIQDVFPHSADLLPDLSEHRTGRILHFGPIIDCGRDRLFDMFKRLNACSQSTQERGCRPCRRSPAVEAPKKTFNPPTGAERYCCIQKIDRGKDGARDAEFLDGLPDVRNSVERRALSALKNQGTLSGFPEEHLNRRHILCWIELGHGRPASFRRGIGGNDTLYLVIVQDSQGMFIHTASGLSPALFKS
jgi:hypothetical protein